jgi:hypothetical protein
MVSARPANVGSGAGSLPATALPAHLVDHALVTLVGVVAAHHQARVDHAGYPAKDRQHEVQDGLKGLAAQ